MTTNTNYTEKYCLNVYWKIKNFNYCSGEIKSSEFNLFNNRYWILINAGILNIECILQVISTEPVFNLRRQISFLTCDGSQEQSITGGTGVFLEVPKDVILGKRRNAFLPKDTLTVRFRFPTNSEKGTIYMSSQIAVKYKCFLWTLKDFCKNEGTTKKSVENSGLYGDIALNLKSKDGYYTDKQFYVEVTRTGVVEKCYYTLKMSVLDTEGKALNEISDEYLFEKTTGTQFRLFPVFFKTNKMLTCGNLVLSEDTVSLKCKFSISLGTLQDQSVLNYCEGATPLLKELEHLSTKFRGKGIYTAETKLNSDLKSILDRGTLADVDLKIGADVIQVHKVILSARSPVFEAMFTKDMREKINNTVVIEDLDLETVRGLVNYMYTNTILDCHWETITKLYSAADKYEVLTLKNKCTSFLKTNLSTSNVCDVLVLANLHQDQDLKSAIFDFISEYGSKIFTLDAWIELEESNTKLAMQVMKEIWCKKRMLN